jgi:hypothetical protein
MSAWPLMSADPPPNGGSIVCPCSGVELTQVLPPALSLPTAVVCGSGVTQLAGTHAAAHERTGPCTPPAAPTALYRQSVLTTAHTARSRAAGAHTLPRPCNLHTHVRRAQDDSVIRPLPHMRARSPLLLLLLLLLRPRQPQPQRRGVRDGGRVTHAACARPHTPAVHDALVTRQGAEGNTAQHSRQQRRIPGAAALQRGARQRQLPHVHEPEAPLRARVPGTAASCCESGDCERRHQHERLRASVTALLPLLVAHGV